MKSQFKMVGILGRVERAAVKETLQKLISCLIQWEQPFIVDEKTAHCLAESHLPTLPRSELSQHCNLVIVVGGDGSLLHTAHAVVNDETPVLGINRGRLGFLTDILPSELEKIKSILEGKFILERRFLLTAMVEYNEKVLGQADALNEVALIPDSLPHMNDFEMYVDNKFVCSQDSDGIIIATPTGSTAYALSGGGPILHPELDALVVVPMFPHTLSLRPIVINGNHRITIKISPTNSATPRLTCDGHGFIATPPGSVIQIQKKSQHLHLIHPIDYDYYASLRSKLHWGRKLENSD